MTSLNGRTDLRYCHHAYIPKTITYTLPLKQIPVNSQREPLPEWLSNTLSHLPRNDPLRILLPPSPQHSSNNTLSDPTEDVPLFAFSQSPDQNLVVQGEHTEETVASNPIGSLHSAYIDYQPNRQGHYSANEHTQPTGLPSPMHPFEKTVNDSELRTFLSDAPALASAMKFDPMLIQSPDLLPLPFSTPGPSSNISFNHPYQPTVTTIPVLPDDIAPNELDGVTAGSPSSILDSFSDLIATEPCVPLSNPSVSTILAPAPRFAFAVDISPSPPLIDEPVLDPIEFDNSLVSTSSPSCMPEIRNLYSTPGPRFEAITSKRIYFDSPTEDPSDSDPFEPTEGYEIEPEELDFKWEPFIRKEIPGYDGGSIAGSISTADQWDYSVEFKYEDFERDSDLDVHAYPTPERISFDGQALPTDTNYTTGKSTAVQSYNDESEKAREVFTPVYTPKTNKAETAFAPAPGVFISPLRNAPESPEQESTSQIQSKPHILYLRETEISQVPIPVTPRNRSNTPPILSGSGKNEEPHSKRYLTPTLSRSRPTQRWQLTQESPEVANVFKERQNGMRDNSMKPMKPASFSQLSNDSIESWN